jgi:hypothetical protein
MRVSGLLYCGCTVLCATKSATGSGFVILHIVVARLKYTLYSIYLLLWATGKYEKKKKHGLLAACYVDVSLSLRAISGLISVRKQAEDIPAAPSTMHMTIIWYRAAMSGDTPDNIFPVIMPGIETSLTANRELVMGTRNEILLLHQGALEGASKKMGCKKQPIFMWYNC